MTSNRRGLKRLMNKAAGTSGSSSGRASIARCFARNDIGLSIDPMPRNTWRVRIGDRCGGYTLERWCDSGGEVADWLSRIAESLPTAQSHVH
jgi:hypothetical protein